MAQANKANAKVYKGDDGLFHWRLRAANGEIVAVGEGYTRKADAERGLEDAFRTFQAAMSPGDVEPGA